MLKWSDMNIGCVCYFTTKRCTFQLYANHYKVLLLFYSYEWLIAKNNIFIYWLLLIFLTQDFSVTQRRHWNISNDGQAALTINRVTKTDEGIWECWELDSQGNVKQKAHVMRLVVTSKWLIIYFVSPPKFQTSFISLM